jgi:hypothetical protein
MQLRLLACLAGGIIGCGLVYLIGNSLDLSPTIAYLGGSVAGVILGYFASALVHAFTAGSHRTE